MKFIDNTSELKISQNIIENEIFNKFKNNFKSYLYDINSITNKLEINYSFAIQKFLKNIFTNPSITIESSNKPCYDLAIKDNNKVNVILELKVPGSTEMISSSNFNVKSMHEIIWYLNQEIYHNKNNETKWLIVTDSINWYIFDAQSFANAFYKNQNFKSVIDGYLKGVNTIKDTKIIYEDIKKYIDKNFDKDNEIIKYYYININSDDNLLLYNIFSEDFLLKKTPNNPVSVLNNNFYKELLYILGLQETKENGKLVIKPNDVEGSLMDITMSQIKYSKGINNNDVLYETVLDLIIIWINRILFLKLLEGQLLKFNNNLPEYSFMNTDKIKTFDDLFDLFFKVLAIEPDERDSIYKKKYPNVPYLNSSLFELTNVENDNVRINEIPNDIEIELYKDSILKKQNYKNTNKENNVLTYLLKFLNSYDFSSDSNKKIQNENRDIINASVLGLIFEKINGYKDGSYYTPEYITAYMCDESIRQAIVQKFIEGENQDFNDFDEVKNYCLKFNNKNDIERFNDYIDSLKICDPSVGSGHFLVSALNTILALKSELNILKYNYSNHVSTLRILQQNNELVILDDYTPYVYDKNNVYNRDVQSFLFNEKKYIIENCLFGVDINPKSVQITRLRLWIELLKNAYYKDENNTKLETLPNIDINIKCGDSLISKYKIKDNQNESPEFKSLIKQYKNLVTKYKNCSIKSDKEALKEQIDDIKNQISEYTESHIDELNELNKNKNAERELENNSNQLSIDFGENYKKKIVEIKYDIELLQKEFEKKYKSIYANAFEWRYEFPEVLDDNGDYVGFDIVIGNPPYIQLQNTFNKNLKYADLYKDMKYYTFARAGDIYCLFYELGTKIVKTNGIVCYISSNKWMRAGYGKNLRDIFINYKPLILIDLGSGIFENATVDTCIMMIQNTEANGNHSLCAVTIEKDKNLPINIKQQIIDKSVILKNLSNDVWFIADDAEQKLKEKIERIGTALKDWEIKIYFGILTGLNEAFIIDDAKRQNILDNCKDDAERERTASIIKPILRGRDIKRYYYQWAGLWVTIIPAGWTNKNRGNESPEIFIEKTYLSLMNYLKNFKNKAKKRDNQGDYWWELRSCSYYEEFEKEKIVYGQFQDDAEYAIAEKGVYLSSNEYMIGGNYNKKYFLAVLNSKLIKWYLNTITGVLGNTLKIGQKSNFIKIPIPFIKTSNEQIVSQIEQLVDEILSAKKSDPNADTTALEHDIDNLVYQLYELTDKEIYLIENNK